MFARFLIAVCVLALPFAAFADDASEPKPVPATRPEAKQALERLKERTARLPLPPPTDDEIAAAREREREREREGRERPSTGSGLGGGVVNNGRMRNLYLPAELRSTSSGVRQKDPAMTLDNAFTVELFWIASRVNNCHYCLGHQESKLLNAGVAEERIAALDVDWSQFTPADRAAFAYARKLTYRPDELTDADLAAVLKHFEPLEVLEMTMLVARYNATNRWTDSLGIPQEGHRDFLTATPAELAEKRSIVAPLESKPRPPLPGREETLAELAKARTRKVRLPVLEESAARERLSAENDAAAIPVWHRLLLHFPVTGKGIIETYEAAQEKGTLSAEVKAQIAWTTARHDRAWYALDLARRRLVELGYEEAAMFELDHDVQDSGSRQAIAFAAKLTAEPQRIVDADIAALRQHFTDHQVAEIVFHATQGAMLNRVTEGAALPLEP
jgi:AhpD family alkylhydroperoxidase